MGLRNSDFKVQSIIFKIMRTIVYFFIYIFPFFIDAQQTSTFYKYILHKPTDTISLKPLIIFLHGSGESGDNPDLLKVHGPLKFLNNNKENNIDAYILVPQCPKGKSWETGILYGLVNKIISEYKIEKKAIHLTGLSMGAWGSWNFAIEHPEILASLVPIAGFVDRKPMLEICKLKDIPVWIFHGKFDDVIDVFYSKEVYKRLRKCSENVDFTIFQDANHDSWTRVYDNPEIYQWMLSQKKQ
jgi:predicted peptidase